MIIKIKRNNDSMYSWDDISYGDVCEFADDDVNTFIGMKVDSSNGEDYLVELENGFAYTDVENYGIVRIIENAVLSETIKGE